MSDQRLRELERAARADGEHAAWERLWRERLRLGLVTRDQLRLAAYCGHDMARTLVPGPGCMSDRTCACTYGSINDVDDRDDWVCLDEKDATPLWTTRTMLFGAFPRVVLSLWQEVCRGYGPMYMIRSERGTPGMPFSEPNWPTVEGMHRVLQAAEHWVNGGALREFTDNALNWAMDPTWPPWLVYGAVAIRYPARLTEEEHGPALQMWWESMHHALNEKREMLGVNPSGVDTGTFIRSYVSRVLTKHALGDLYDE